MSVGTETGSTKESAIMAALTFGITWVIFAVFAWVLQVIAPVLLYDMYFIGILGLAVAAFFILDIMHQRREISLIILAFVYGMISSILVMFHQATWFVTGIGMLAFPMAAVIAAYIIERVM